MVAHAFRVKKNNLKKGRAIWYDPLDMSNENLPETRQLVADKTPTPNGVRLLLCREVRQSAAKKCPGQAKPNRGVFLVRIAGLEPARVAPQPPQGCVSTNSTTSAIFR